MDDNPDMWGHRKPGLSLGVLSEIKHEYEGIIAAYQKNGYDEWVRVYSEMLEEVEERIRERERLN